VERIDKLSPVRQIEPECLRILTKYDIVRRMLSISLGNFGRVYLVRNLLAIVAEV